MDFSEFWCPHLEESPYFYGKDHINGIMELETPHYSLRLDIRVVHYKDLWLLHKHEIVNLHTYNSSVVEPCHFEYCYKLDSYGDS